MDKTVLRNALRMLRLEETRLRSAALAFSNGMGTTHELELAAKAYGVAARQYRRLEMDKGATLTPEEAEAVR